MGVRELRGCQGGKEENPASADDRSGNEEAGDGDGLWNLVRKLGDPVGSVRLKALRKLQFRMVQNLVNMDALYEVAEGLGRKLLEWFNQPSPSHEQTVLSILVKLAQDSYMKAQLLELGALEFMEQFRSHNVENLSPLVDLLISILSEWHASRVCGDGGNTPFVIDAAFPRPWLHSIRRREFVPSPDIYSSYGGNQLPNPGFHEVGPILPYIDLQLADNQYLFELNGRLQDVHHPAIVEDALRELRETVVVDFHPEALLQTHPILENVLALIHTLKTSDLVPVALDFLCSLVRRIKGALSLSFEAAFQVHPDAENTNYSGADHTIGSGTVYPADVAKSYPVSIKQDTTLTRNSHGSLGANTRPVLYLGRSLHMMTLQLIKLLTEIKHHQSTFKILRELLLLLKPPEDGNFDSQLRTQYMQYFGALDDVVGTLGGEFDDLGALCMSSIMQDGEDSRETWQWRCIPVLTVLSYAADMLSLLKPAEVVGLLPFTLIKAMKALTSDLILAECNFGIHTRILPYLQFLDRDYYHAYCVAHDAYMTIDAALKLVNAGYEGLTMPDTAASPSQIVGEVYVQSLVKHMSQATPYLTEFEDAILVRRFIFVALNLLEIEVDRFQINRDKNMGKLRRIKRIRSDLANSGTQNFWLVFNADLEHKLADTGYLVFLLLSHKSGNVRKTTYEALLAISLSERSRTHEWCALHEIGFGDACGVGNMHDCLSPPSAPLSPASILHNVFIRGSRIMSELLTNGLHDSATCKPCAELLLNHVEFLHLHDRLEMLPALSWIACSASLTRECSTTDRVANLLLHAIESERNNETLEQTIYDGPSTAWIEISFFLRPLFSLSSSERCRAAKELLEALQNCCQNDGYIPWWIAQSEICSRRNEQGHYMNDPFRHELLFDEKDRLCQSVRFINVLKDSGSPEGCDFIRKRKGNVDELMDIVKSTSLCGISRRSAVEKLCKLSQDSFLRHALEDDQGFLETLVDEVLSWMKMSYHEAEERKVLMKSGTEEETTLTVVTMGEACLGLLTILATSPSSKKVGRVRSWLVRDPKRRVEPFLPLLFHPNSTVRTKMGLLLCFLLFSADLLYSDLQKVVSTDDQLYPESALQIPYPLTEEVQLFVPVTFTSCYRFPCRAVPVDLSQADDVAAEIVHCEPLIHQMVAQLRLLDGKFRSLVHFHEVKSSIGSKVGISPEELQAVRCIRALSADYAMKALLEQLADSKDCEDETHLLVELAAQCSRHPEAAIILARSEWRAPFERFLTICPTSEEEASLLLKALHVLEVMMSTKSIPSTGLLFLATSSKETLLPSLASRLLAGLGEAVQGRSLIPNQVDLSILHLMFNLLLSAENHVDRELFGRIVTVLLESLSLLAKGMAVDVGGKLSTNIFSFVNRSLPLQRTRVEEQQKEERSNGVSEKWLVERIVPLVKYIARFYITDFPSLKYKQLVREIVYCLWCITSSILPSFWQDLWASTGVTHWLSRLVCDEEGTVRGMGFGILAMLASPVTPVTQKMLLKNWPEVGVAATRSVLNTQECYAVRQESLRFILASNFWSAACKVHVEALVGDGEMQIDFEEVDPFNINATLRKCKFWEAFPMMLTEQNGTPGFYRVFLELLRRLALTDITFIQDQFILVPNIFDALLQHLACPTSDFESQPRKTFDGTRESYVTVWEKKIMHTRIQLADRYAVIAQIAEILELLAHNCDSALIGQVFSTSTVAALICAFCHCGLDDEELESSLLSYGTYKGPKQRLLEEIKPTPRAITEYERAEAVFHVATTLNTLLQHWYSQDAKCEFSHLQALSPGYDASRSSQKSLEADDTSLKTDYVADKLTPSDMHVNDILSASGRLVCSSAASLLKAYPSVSHLRRVIKSIRNDDDQAQCAIDDYPLLWRMWLSVCALLATLLSQEEKAQLVLGEEQESQSASSNDEGAKDHAAKICEALIPLVEELYAESQRAKASRDSQFLEHLVFVLTAVGRALQNVLTFSAIAKSFALQSLMPRKLVKLAHEAHSILAYGYIRSFQTIVRRSKRGRWVVCKPKPPPEKALRWNYSWHAKSDFGQLGKRMESLNEPRSRQHNFWKAVGERDVRKFRALLFEELLVFIRLLEHLVYRSPEAAEASIGSGVFSLVKSIWQFAHKNEDLLSELLGLLSNLAAQSDQGKVIITKVGLMESVVDLVLTPAISTVCYGVGLSLLQTLMTRAEPRARFLHKQSLVPLISQLRELIRTKGGLRQHLLLQLLVNVAAFPHGQFMVSKHLSCDGQFDLVLNIIEQGDEPAASSGLFLLRNLSFSQDCQVHFVSNDRTIPLLLRSLKSPCLEGRAYAASAIWELMLKGSIFIPIFKQSALLLLEAEMRARADLTKMNSSLHKNTKISSHLGHLVRQIEQSLFAVNRLIGEDFTEAEEN